MNDGKDETMGPACRRKEARWKMESRNEEQQLGEVARQTHPSPTRKRLRRGLAKETPVVGSKAAEVQVPGVDGGCFHGTAPRRACPKGRAGGRQAAQLEVSHRRETADALEGVLQFARAHSSGATKLRK